jgi:mRNA interferase MazF
MPAKRRPVVVVQNNRNNQRLHSAIVAAITSNTRLAGVEPTQVLIDLSVAQNRTTGLAHTSVVKCENLYLKLQSDMRKIGMMPLPLMQQVDTALKASLDLQ